MKRLIKLEVSGIKHLKSIIKDLESNGGKNRLCPCWGEYIKYSYIKRSNKIISLKDINRRFDCSKDCYICRMLFPRCTSSNEECPCDVYTFKHIIRRLYEIIKFNKE